MGGPGVASLVLVLVAPAGQLPHPTGQDGWSHSTQELAYYRGKGTLRTWQ